MASKGAGDRRADRPRSDVAVIIPCFNHAPYLGECLKSLQGQRLAPAEVVVVDDGSDDDVGAVCAEFPEVRYMWKEHGGVSSARNVGLRETEADLVMFPDADDLLLPHAIAELSTGLRDAGESADAVFGRGERFCDNSRGEREIIDAIPPFTELEPYCGRRVGDGRYCLTAAFAERLLRASVVPQCAALIRRRVYRSVGAWDEALSSVEDRDMWVRIAAQSEIVFCDQPVARIRRHQSNRSHAGNWVENHKNIVAILSKVRHGSQFPRRLKQQAGRQLATTAYLLSCRLMDAGDYAGASRALATALGARPFYPRAWVRYGQCVAARRWGATNGSNTR